MSGIDFLAVGAHADEVESAVFAAQVVGDGIGEAHMRTNAYSTAAAVSTMPAYAGTVFTVRSPVK